MGFELAKAYITVRGDSSRLRGDFMSMRSLTHAHVSAMNSVIARGVALFSLYRGAMLAVSGIELAGEMEQTQIAFETMMGSTKEATALLKELYGFARTTPFRFEGVVGAARILMATGTPMKELMGLMRDLGDVSAGSGKNFKELAIVFGQVRSKGRLMAEEILQFTEANIPVLQVLSRTLKMSERQILDLTKKGKISFKQLETAIRSMAKEGGIFANLTERQSKSVLGLWSNLQDSVQFTMMTIFQALQPLTKGFLEFALKMTDSVQNSVISMQGSINDFGLDMLEWMQVTQKNWDTTWDLISMYASMKFLEIEDSMNSLSFSTVDITTSIVSAFKAGFGVAVQYGIDFFKTMGLGFAYLGVSIVRFASDVGNILPAALKYVVNSLYEELKSLNTQINEMFFLIGRTGANIAEGIVDAFAAIFTSNTISDAFGRTMDRILIDFDKTESKLREIRDAPQRTLVDEFKNNIFTSTFGMGVEKELDKMLDKMENTDPLAKAKGATNAAFIQRNELTKPVTNPGIAALNSEINRIKSTLTAAKMDLESQRKPPEEYNQPRPGPFTGTGGTDNEFLKSGRYDFADVGKKLQDAILKTEDDKQDRMIGLLERGNKLQEDQLKAMAKPVKVDIGDANFGLGD